MSITAEKIAAVFDDWSKPSKLRLHAGEMTKEELRTVRAILPAVKAAILALLQQGEPEGALRKAYNKIEQHMLDYTHETHSYDASTNAWECSNGEVVAYVEGLDKALEIIKPLLSASPLPPAPGAETGETTDKIGGFDGTGIYKRSIAPDPITGQGDARSLDIKRDWCIEAAKREGDAEVGAGYHSLPEAVAALSSRQAVLEAIAVNKIVADAAVTVANRVMNEIGSYGKVSRVTGAEAAALLLRLAKLATTPPAEGETK